MENLSKKSNVELKELIQRQITLLCNKKLVANLKDKGERIQNFKKELEEEIASREEKALSESITSNKLLHLTATETLEWTGKCAIPDEVDSSLDSDDEVVEETDPLKILAEQAGAGHYKKIYRNKKAEERLITDADVLEATESVGSENNAAYVNKLCYREEHSKRNSRIPFKPNSTVKSPPHVSPSHKKPKGPHWEVTAATPPEYTLGDVKSVSLCESIKLQKQHTDNLQKCRTKQITDRLAAQIEQMHLAERRGSDASSSTCTAEDGEDDEHIDEDDDRGVVIYSLVD